MPLAAEAVAHGAAREPGGLVVFVATLPNHVCLDEALITPTWNRTHVAQLQRGV